MGYCTHKESDPSCARPATRSVRGPLRAASPRVTRHQNHVHSLRTLFCHVPTEFFEFPLEAEPGARFQSARRANGPGARQRGAGEEDDEREDCEGRAHCCGVGREVGSGSGQGVMAVLGGRGRVSNAIADRANCKFVLTNQT